MGMVVAQFEVFLVALDPTIGSEIQKTRPCLVISPNEMNQHLATAIVAPMTTKGKPYPSRIPIRFQGKDGLIVLDQIRTVDKTRLVKKLGSIDDEDRKAVLSLLFEMFAEE
jgi:mRNA interferase MazF